MRLILGLPPPASSPFLPPRSLPRTGPLLRSGSRACFRACPRAGSCPSPHIVPISPPRSLPRTGPRLRSRSRACFRACPALVSVPVPASSPFPLLGLYPAPVPASAPVPAPVSVPIPRRSLSQSRPRSPSLPRSCPASVSPALRSVRSSFRVPKVACRSIPAFFPGFLGIPFFSVSTLPPSSFALSGVEQLYF